MGRLWGWQMLGNAGSILAVPHILRPLSWAWFSHFNPRWASGEGGARETDPAEAAPSGPVAHPRLSQGQAAASGVAAFPGPAQAASTFLTSWERLGLAKPGVPSPAQAPRLLQSQAQHPGLVRKASGSRLEWGVGTACLACPRWVGRRLRGVEGSLQEPQPQAWPEQLGCPPLTPSSCPL